MGRYKKDNLFWAYIAGLIDADGHIGLVRIIRRDRNNVIAYYPQIQFSNTSKNLMKYLNKNFSNYSIYYSISSRRQKPYHKKVHSWRIGKREHIKRIIEKIIPYLVIKEKQAKILLQFIKFREKILRDKYNASYSKKEYDIYLRLKKLNKKGLKNVV